MMVSFCAVFFPTGVLDGVLNLIESVSEGFPSYSCFNNQVRPFLNKQKINMYRVLSASLPYFAAH